MRVEEALATYLRSVPGVSALVGSRIHPLKAPQDTKVAHIVYEMLGGTDVAAHDGFSGLRDGRISYSCIAPTYALAKSVAEAVRGALVGYRGVLSGLDVRIPQAFEDEDLYDDTLGLYIVIVDFELMWRGA